MRYADLSANEDQIKILIQWLWDEVKSSGGDGDAIWYSRYYDVNDIFPLVDEFNREQKYSFEECELVCDTIYWSDQQEGIIITNSKLLWDTIPDWQQVSLRW